MGRLLVLLAVVVLVVWLLKRALAGSRGRDAGPRKDALGGGAVRGELVDCAHCGVKLPEVEARSAGGRHFCSEEHWRLGPRDG